MFNERILGFLADFALQADLLLFAQSDFDDRHIGRWIFAAVFAALLAWLVWLPRKSLGLPESAPSWWRDVRFWAIFIAGVQLLVYVFFS